MIANGFALGFRSPRGTKSEVCYGTRVMSDEVVDGKGA